MQILGLKKICGNAFSFRWLLVGIFHIIFLSVVFAQENALAPTPEIHLCKDKQVGVQFFCSPDWEVINQYESFMVIISDTPKATMTVNKVESPIGSMSEISLDMLQVMGQYSDDFVYEEVTLLNRRAIKITATSSEDSQISLLDFYFLDGGYLYSVMFTVNPIQERGLFAPVIQTIVQSLELIDSNMIDDDDRGEWLNGE